jgi:CMP-2-keto-3-deoxyoctulosonic acid synthetase
MRAFIGKIIFLVLVVDVIRRVAGKIVPIESLARVERLEQLRWTGRRSLVAKIIRAVKYPAMGIDTCC